MIIRERVFAAVVLLAILILTAIWLTTPEPATCGAENCAQLLGESAPLVGENP